METVLPKTIKKEVILGGRRSIIKINSQAHFNDTLTNDLQIAQFFLIEKSVLPLVKQNLPHNNFLICPGGEACKTPAIFENIIQSFFDAKLSRTDCVAIIGGGALCDVGSFATSLYMRGIPLVLFPTTLLSMVDASIGGKTAINYGNLKNMLGSFYPASRIFIYPHFLSTLDTGHLNNGLAEVLKAGMLHDAKIISLLETHTQELQKPYNSNTHNLWLHIIWNAIKVKIHFVKSDFTETAVRGAARVFLNLGHSFAHAIEAQSKIVTKKNNTTNFWEHGKAVALGIRSALLLGQQLQLTSTTYSKKIINILDSFSYPSCYPQAFSAQDLIDHMKKDKKNTNKELRLVLQSDMCKTFIQTVSEDKITTVLQKLGAR